MLAVVPVVPVACVSVGLAVAMSRVVVVVVVVAAAAVVVTRAVSVAAVVA